MAQLTKEQILAEIEYLLRVAPTIEKYREHSMENIAFYGRLKAVIYKWQASRSSGVASTINTIRTKAVSNSYTEQCYFDLMMLLHQASSELRMETVGPVDTAIGHGMVFDYFDEIKQLIKTASTDILFVDPYLSDEFVTMYLPYARQGIAIRLLAREKMPTLVPAAKLFKQQHQLKLQIRSAPNFHDRYILIDEVACYQSGASFKDGGKTAPTTITQITDAFTVVRQTYEALWQEAKVEL